jgi:hypothetical protein
MAVEEGRTQCVSCREPIQRGALKCPHCRSLQNRFAVWSIRIAPWLLALLPVVFLVLAIQRDFRAPDFAIARERLAVVQSTFHYADGGEKCGPNISVVGTLRNNGDIPVKDIFVEVRYFDAAGMLIDTEGAEQYSLVIPPAAEVAFRVRSQPARARADYASHRVTIVTARDARSVF